jgi:hypothetical protein
MPPPVAWLFCGAKFSTVAVHDPVDNVWDKALSSMTTRLRQKRLFFNQRATTLAVQV